MSLTNYAVQGLLAALLGKTSNFGTLSSVPDLYLAAYTTNPGEATAGTEVTNANNYSRLNVAGTDFSAPTLADPSASTNSGDLIFPTASGSWGTVTGIALVDSGTIGAGNVIAFDPAGLSVAITTGKALRIVAGSLNLTFD